MSRKRKGPAEGPVPRGVIPEGSLKQEDFTTEKRACQGRRRRRLDIEKPAYWAVLPAGVRYDETLPASAKLLYAEISSLTNQEGYCYASNAYFMALYGISDATVLRLLRVLEQRGYIRREDAVGGKTQRRIYAGINPAAAAPADPPSKMKGPPVKNDGGPPSKMKGGTIKSNNISNNPPEAPRRGRRVKSIPDWKPDLFERFWKKYPRHEDRAKAVEEWDRLKPDLELMKNMSAALDRMMKSDEWRRGIGIPYACRWLRYRRWEDAFEEPEEEPGDTAEDGDDEWLY